MVACEMSVIMGFLDSGETLEPVDASVTNYAQSSPNQGAIPCYSSGTMIETPDGLRAVEALRPGDLVLTMDHGPQPVCWVRRSDCPLEGVDVENMPILFFAGALGS